MKHKVGVLGDLDSIIGFRALGMTVVETETEARAIEMLKQWQKEEYAIVFLTEQLAANMGEEEMAYWRNVWLPSVIVIPSAREKATLGLQALHLAVRRATGIDLLGKKE